jgi:DNA segregation ATPase FtsK/SpoIIIE-like protein
VVSFIREHNERGEFDESFTREIEIETAKCLMNNKKKGEQVSIDDFDGLGGGNVSRDDAVLLEAMELIVTMDRVGTSAFQRHMNLGYGRAAKLVDRLEKMGFIGPDDGKKKGRPVYLTRNQLAEYKLNGMPGSGGLADSVEDGEEE